jgi:putative transposase
VLDAIDRLRSGVIVPVAHSSLAELVLRVNEPLSERELAAIPKSAQKGSPHWSPEWIEQAATRPELGSTLRNRGRPQIHFPENRDEPTNNES